MKLLLFISMIFLIGCGTMEQAYDKQNYESLTNETGTVHVYSGGIEIATYENATVIYSSSDTQAMWIETKDGNTKYLQGDCIIDLD